MYETFEHTADLGLRIRAVDLNTLFAEAGQALFETIVEDLRSVRHEKRVIPLRWQLSIKAATSFDLQFSSARMDTTRFG